MLSKFNYLRATTLSNWHSNFNQILVSTASWYKFPVHHPHHHQPITWNIIIRLISKLCIDTSMHTLHTHTFIVWPVPRSFPVCAAYPCFTQSLSLPVLQWKLFNELLKSVDRQTERQRNTRNRNAKIYVTKLHTNCARAHMEQIALQTFNGNWAEKKEKKNQRQRQSELKKIASRASHHWH